MLQWITLKKTKKKIFWEMVISRCRSMCQVIGPQWAKEYQVLQSTNKKQQWWVLLSRMTCCRTKPTAAFTLELKELTRKQKHPVCLSYLTFFSGIFPSIISAGKSRYVAPGLPCVAIRNAWKTFVKVDKSPKVQMVQLCALFPTQCVLRCFAQVANSPLPWESLFHLHGSWENIRHNNLDLFQGSVEHPVFTFST